MDERPDVVVDALVVIPRIAMRIGRRLVVTYRRPRHDERTERGDRGDRDGGRKPGRDPAAPVLDDPLLRARGHPRGEPEPRIELAVGRSELRGQRDEAPTPRTARHMIGGIAERLSERDALGDGVTAASRRRARELRK
jgi:hypothetical protein